MPFKLIQIMFEVVFWCLEWECCPFWKIDGNSFKSTNTILWNASFLQFSDKPSVVIIFHANISSFAFTFSELPRPCFATLFNEGEDKMDYFTCKDCSFNCKLCLFNKLSFSGIARIFQPRGGGGGGAQTDFWKCVYQNGIFAY